MLQIPRNNKIELDRLTRIQSIDIPLTTFFWLHSPPTKAQTSKEKGQYYDTLLSRLSTFKNIKHLEVECRHSVRHPIVYEIISTMLDNNKNKIETFETHGYGITTSLFNKIMQSPMDGLNRLIIHGLCRQLDQPQTIDVIPQFTNIKYLSIKYCHTIDILKFLHNLSAMSNNEDSVSPLETLKIHHDLQFKHDQNQSIQFRFEQLKCVEIASDQWGFNKYQLIDIDNDNGVTYYPNFLALFAFKVNHNVTSNKKYWSNVEHLSININQNQCPSMLFVLQMVNLVHFNHLKYLEILGHNIQTLDEMVVTMKYIESLRQRYLQLFDNPLKPLRINVMITKKYEMFEWNKWDITSNWTKIIRLLQKWYLKADMNVYLDITVSFNKYIAERTKWFDIVFKSLAQTFGNPNKLNQNFTSKIRFLLGRKILPKFITVTDRIELRCQNQEYHDTCDSNESKGHINLIIALWSVHRQENHKQLSDLEPNCLSCDCQAHAMQSNY